MKAWMASAMLVGWMVVLVSMPVGCSEQPLLIHSGVVVEKGLTPSTKTGIRVKTAADTPNCSDGDIAFYLDDRTDYEPPATLATIVVGLRVRVHFPSPEPGTVTPSICPQYEVAELVEVVNE